MGAADVLLAEAFLRLEGVCRELVKTLHTVKSAPSAQVCYELGFVTHMGKEFRFLVHSEARRAANIEDCASLQVPT